jgi:hypothetical protein
MKTSWFIIVVSGAFAVGLLEFGPLFHGTHSLREGQSGPERQSPSLRRRSPSLPTAQPAGMTMVSLASR